MQREGIAGNPLPSSSTSTPDFQLQPPADCFVEVSTLNIAGQDKRTLDAKKSVALDHAETIRRVLEKLTDEKCKQLMYAANKAKPGVLALFDYTTWSGFGTQFFRALGEALLGTQFTFKNLPPELSAIVYLERKVLDGRVALSRQRSAVYYNPLALHPLRPGWFERLRARKGLRSQIPAARGAPARLPIITWGVEPRAVASLVPWSQSHHRF